MMHKKHAYPYLSGLLTGTVTACLLICLFFANDVFAQTESREKVTEIITFSARDSLLINMTDGKMARLFGNSRVEHPSGKLTAGAISLDLDENLAIAEARRIPIDESQRSELFMRWLQRKGEFYAPIDTLSMPVLTRDGEDISSRRIMFNFVTEKGKFDVARMGYEGGNITGTQVKAPAAHVIFIQDAIYSTCNLDHPHYYIRADRMKIVDEEEVFFTNARLFILDIPYPILFPFGYLPSQLKRKRSGLLEPGFIFQDQGSRGLGIENFGWFQYFNDYLTGLVSASVFTSGTFFSDGNLNYAKRNRFSGSLRLGWSRERGFEETDPDFSRFNNYRLELNHQQTINPFTNISANINLRTSDYFIRNSYDINERAETSTSSRASLNYRQPDGLYTLGISMQQSQNFANNSVQLLGPNVNYSFRRFNPFQQKGVRRAQQRWYETLAIGYNGQITSRFAFTPRNDPETGEPIEGISWIDALFSPSKYREATGDLGHVRYGMTQRAEATMQLSTSNFYNLTTSLRLNEFWYPETIRKDFNPETNRVEDRIVKGFAAARTFNTSVTASTTIYGISNARIGSLQGFRHTIRPSTSFSYQPDFTKEFWGYFREVPTDTLGNTRQYSIFERGVVGGPTAGEQRAISFNLSNVFETKQVRRDTTGERNERIIRIIDDLRASASYNFAATQFKLSDLNTSITSNVLQGIRLNANANFSFYAQDSLGRTIDKYIWEDSKRIMRITNYSINASLPISFGRTGARIETAPIYYPYFYDPFDQTIFSGFDPNFNQSFISMHNMPITASLRFSYSWRFVDFNNSNRSAVLNADNITVQLTRGWRLSTSIGYDFIREELTPSRFAVSRNLHCWNFNFEWNPFGNFKFFRFSLTVSDSQMRSLFQMLPGLNDLERRSSPIGRR